MQSTGKYQEIIKYLNTRSFKLACRAFEQTGRKFEVVDESTVKLLDERNSRRTIQKQDSCEHRQYATAGLLKRAASWLENNGLGSILCSVHPLCLVRETKEKDEGQS